MVPPLKDKHGELFNLAFMCARNLDPDAFFARLVKPEDLFLIDLILIESETNEGIFMLGVIQTLLKWQSEML